MSQTAYEKEINRIMTAVELGAMSAEEGKAKVAEIKSRYSMGGETNPPTTPTTAVVAAAPRRSAKASLQMGQPTPPKKDKCKWVPMELPEPVDSEGNPITEGLSAITVRAVEGGKMVPDPEKGKNGKKWQGSGLPGGKIAIGTGWRNELTLTPAQFLQLHAKMEEIYNAVMGHTDADGNEVAGLLDDSQPREILVL